MLEKIKKSLVIGGAGVVGALIFMIVGTDPSMISQEALKHFLGEAAQNQITQAGFFFTLAAWLHSGRVKKEIKSNFASLTEAINNVAESLRQDLKNHSNRLDNLTSRVETVENNLNLKKG